MGNPLQLHHAVCKTADQIICHECKAVIYRRYVDDTFLLFHSKHHIEKFQNYSNRQHKNIRGVVVIATAQLHSAKFELKFCTGSNPACSMSEICDGEDL